MNDPNTADRRAGVGIFVRYDPATGELLASGDGTASTTDTLRRVTGGSYLFLEWGFGQSTAQHVERCRTQYVNLRTGWLTAKAPCPARREGHALVALPRPCRVEISQPGNPPTLYDWSEDEIALTFEHPGLYDVRVLSAPHLPGVFLVAWP